jgi:uncharacterized protein
MSPTPPRTAKRCLVGRQDGAVTTEVAPPALDQEVAATRDLPGRWFLLGLAQVLLPLGGLLLVLVVVFALGLPTGDSAASGYTLLAEVLGGLGIWWLGARLAARYGGWRAAFGLDLPRAGDVGTVLGWTFLQLGSRLALLVALPESWSDSHGGNTEGISDLTTAGLVLTAVASVLVAPVVEELGFRGVVLRGLMRRSGFWPAALVSSALFGALHALGAARLSAVPLLVAATALFGLLQCVLVRRTGRLGPAIGVHATMNALVLALAVGADA